MTEAEQVADLKEQLQQQQEQINALSKRKRMRTWERTLIYPVLVWAIFHFIAFKYLW